MFSMSLRQLGKMNLGQSFGRDSNDLNALARLGLRGRRGRPPGVGEEPQARTWEQPCPGKAGPGQTHGGPREGAGPASTLAGCADFGRAGLFPGSWGDFLMAPAAALVC